MCENYVTSRYVAQPHGNVDRYMKERLSLIELVMRQRQDEINEMNRTLEQRAMEARLRMSGNDLVSRELETQIRALDAGINKVFDASVNELNVRFQQAGVPLRYHNGFIQVAKDEQIEKQVAKPFWDAIADPKWANVATDMNEALDRRDNGAGDAALHACKALESAIKIVSDQKGWTTGLEKGAQNYIDNLVKERNGARFIETFEMEVLKPYFTHVRNKLGHGPGAQPMLNLTAAQTDWAIEFAMSVGPDAGPAGIRRQRFLENSHKPSMPLARTGRANGRGSSSSHAQPSPARRTPVTSTEPSTTPLGEGSSGRASSCSLPGAWIASRWPSSAAGGFQLRYSRRLVAAMIRLA